jgi:hypothetical protein
MRTDSNGKLRLITATNICHNAEDNVFDRHNSLARAFGITVAGNSQAYHRRRQRGLDVQIEVIHTT